MRAAAGTSTMMPTGSSFADGVPFGPQLGGDVVEDGPRGPELGQGRNQGKQNPEVAQRAGAQQGAELGPEEPGIAQREPQASQTQGRVGFRLAAVAGTPAACRRPGRGSGS